MVVLSKQEEPVVRLKLPVIACAPEIRERLAALNRAEGGVEVRPFPLRVIPSQDVAGH
jgi:hypothetical protein